MNSFDTLSIPKFDPDEHDERIKARLAESIQFRLQQQINLKEDEIIRLRNDLSFIKSEIDTFSDSYHAKNKNLIEEYEEMRKKVANAKSEAEIKLQQCRTQHSKDLQQIDEEFQEESRSLQSQLETALFANLNESRSINQKMERNISKKDKRKSLIKKNTTLSTRSSVVSKEEENSTNNEDNLNINIDNFIADIRATKTKAKESIAKHEKNRRPLTDADLELNDRKIDELNETISTMNDKKGKLKDQIAALKHSISQIDLNKDETIDFCKDISDTSFDSNASDNDKETTILAEKVDLAQRKLEEFKNKNYPNIEKLKNQLKTEMDKVETKKKKIADKSKETDELAQRIQHLKEKKKADAQMQKDKYEKDFKKKHRNILKMLKSMTSEQKDIHLQGLVVENQSLKREIYRLDSMIYGKSGKYHNWKNI